MALERSGVPAVTNAVAILRFLEERNNEPATMTVIARGTGINPSTCYNILKTLEAESLVAFDGEAKTYRLGFGLIRLAAAIDGHHEVVEVALEAAQSIADRTELACLVVRVTDAHDYLVVDKAESRRPIKVTVAIGERFPVTSAALAKAYFPWLEERVVARLLQEHGLPAFSKNSITDAAEFVAQFEKVRQHGFATSYGEYFPDHNALAAPIFDRFGSVTHLLLIVGFAFELPEELMATYGEYLRDAAAKVTRKIGGRSAVVGEQALPESSL